MKFKRLVEEIILNDSEGNELTKAQVNFFKNSKVRDKDGKLLVCYHGTNQSFDTFSKGDVGFHFGTLFQANKRQDSKDNSKWNLIRVYLNIKNYFIFDKDIGEWSPLCIAEELVFGDVMTSLYKTHSDYRNSLNDEDLEVKYSEFYPYKEKLYDIIRNYPVSEKDIYNSIYSKKIRDIFKGLGYDGIKYLNKFENDDSIGSKIKGDGVESKTKDDYSYIAFYPNQIKSIYNKKPSVSNSINESINYKSIFDSVKNKYDLTGQKDGGKCNEVSDYIEKYFNLPKVEVSVLKIDGSNITPISIGNHYVNKDGDKLIDFTLPQYSKYLNKRYEDIPIPNVALYDKEEDCYKSDLVTYII